MNFFILITISSCTGTDPPTNPVFPPWGTMARCLSLQYFKIAWIYSELLGMITSEHLPMYFFEKSILYGLISSWSLIMFSVPTMSESFSTSSSVNFENYKEWFFWSTFWVYEVVEIGVKIYYVSYGRFTIFCFEVFRLCLNLLFTISLR